MIANDNSDDDRANIFDVHDAIDALKAAQDALRAAMVGHGQAEREMFLFHVGLAIGRLRRVQDRIHGEKFDAP
jgi:hypothetical protein